MEIGQKIKCVTVTGEKIRGQIEKILENTVVVRTNGRTELVRIKDLTEQ